MTAVPRVGQGRYGMELVFSPSLFLIPEGEQVVIHANSEDVDNEQNKTSSGDMISASSLVPLKQLDGDKSVEALKILHRFLMVCRESQHRRETEYELTNRSYRWLLDKVLVVENGLLVSQASSDHAGEGIEHSQDFSLRIHRHPDLKTLSELLNQHHSVCSANDSLDEPYTGEYDEKEDTWEADILDSLAIRDISSESRELLQGMIHVRDENREEVAIL